jgi:hypothetical protein
MAVFPETTLLMSYVFVDVYNGSLTFIVLPEYPVANK